MATVAFAPNLVRRGRVPLAEIDAIVSARLGATRGLGKSQPACFNRQIAMYLAKHVSGWTTTVIGRFYNGRDHSTVCYGIQRVEALRETDPDVDALVTSLKNQLKSEGDPVLSNPSIDKHDCCSLGLTPADLDCLVELIAKRVYEHIETLISGKDQRSPVREDERESGR